MLQHGMQRLPAPRTPALLQHQQRAQAGSQPSLRCGCLSPSSSPLLVGLALWVLQEAGLDQVTNDAAAAARAAAHDLGQAPMAAAAAGVSTACHAEGSDGAAGGDGVAGVHALWRTTRVDSEGVAFVLWIHNCGWLLIIRPEHAQRLELQATH